MGFSKYCYPDTDILINKYHIRDEKLLAKLEIQKVTISLLSLSLNPNKVIATKDISHLKAIHFYLFGGVYEWAGDFRTENIIKGERVLSGASAAYSDSQDIEKELKKWFEKYSADNLLQAGNKKSLIVNALVDLWGIHPFREGNTRTVITFLWHYLLSIGVSFNVELLRNNPKYVRDTLVMANYGEYRYLCKIMSDALGDFMENDFFISVFNWT